MSEVVTKNDLAKILSRLPFLKLSLTNLVDGSADGSVRGINTSAEGSSYTMGPGALAEGKFTKAPGDYSHAEGSFTTAKGNNSHAEGITTNAIGYVSHAEGFYTDASGAYSHTQNKNTVANREAQTAIGRYNDNKSDTVLEIGNGSSTKRSNSHEFTWDGDTRLALNTSATSGTDKEIYDALVALGWDSDVIG